MNTILRKQFLAHVGQTSPSPMLVEVERAEGTFFYTPEGKRYYDLVAGVSVSNVGHCNPAVVRAVQEQAARYMHVMVYGELIETPQVEYAAKIASLLPAPLESVYFVNSGAEAVEGALKLAKRFTGRTEMISMRRAYHGSTHGAMSMMGTPEGEEWKAAFRPLLPDVRAIEFNDFEALDRITRRTAAAAAAIVLLAMSVEFFVVRHLTADSTTVLVTAENSKGRFTLPDGSVVWLNADSRLAYSNRFVDSEKREVRLEGEAFFDVRRDTLRPFEVTMGDLEVRVLGTRFNASHIPDLGIEEVTLLSGSVEVGHDGSRETVRLLPDQSCAYDTVSGRLAVRNVRASNYGSWTGDSIVFDNMTLEDIAVNLEHWYNIRIRIDDGVDASTRISFTLRPETLDETLRIIENLTHFACERTDRQHITIRKR